MPTIPQPLINLGAGVVVVFLVVVVIWLILKIIQAVKGASLNKGQTDCPPAGEPKRPSCYYLEGAINERSAITRIEADGKASRECLIKLGGTMERLIVSSDKQVEILTRIAANRP